MTIDVRMALGASAPRRDFSWSPSEVMLYHLALGAGSNPGDDVNPLALRFTFEDDLQVLPSFGIVAPTFHADRPPELDLPGCRLDLSQVVHGSQSIHVARRIPASGQATVDTRVVDLWDKGTAAVIWIEEVARDLAGEQLWTATSSLFVRGEGGWGGRRGDSVQTLQLDRPSDRVLTFQTAPNQAQLYRLCGDRNRLHVDPVAARSAGFSGPILHGLCTYGIALRLLVDAFLDGQPAKVTQFGARFAGPVHPGEALHVAVWAGVDGYRFRVFASAGSDGKQRLVMDDGQLLTTR